MNFREFIDLECLEEGRLQSAMKAGVLAGIIGASAADSFASVKDAASPSPEVPKASASVRLEPKSPDKASLDTPRYKKMISGLKDQGRYYDSATRKMLVKMAEDGDEWAIRELPWPKDHSLHNQGRPFFRNDGPQPKGLIPHTGY